MSTSEQMESFERRVIAGLSGVKKILPTTPIVVVNAHLDTGKVTIELPAATSGVRIPLDVATRLSESIDKAGMALLDKFPPPRPMPLGIDHLPVKVDVTRDRLIQFEFQSKTAGVEMEAWQAVQLSEVIRRATRFVVKLNRRMR